MFERICQDACLQSQNKKVNHASNRSIHSTLAMITRTDWIDDEDWPRSCNLQKHEANHTSPQFQTLRVVTKMEQQAQKAASKSLVKHKNSLERPKSWQISPLGSLLYGWSPLHKHAAHRYFIVWQTHVETKTKFGTKDGTKDWPPKSLLLDKTVQVVAWYMKKAKQKILAVCFYNHMERYSDQHLTGRIFEIKRK
jgi:hypothetical protein